MSFRHLLRRLARLVCDCPVWLYRVCTAQGCLAPGRDAAHKTGSSFAKLCARKGYSLLFHRRMLSEQAAASKTEPLSLETTINCNLPISFSSLLLLMVQKMLSQPGQQGAS